MKRFAITAGMILSALCVGTILGPVVIAATMAKLAPAKTRIGTSAEAEKLVDAYMARLEPGILFMTVVIPSDGEECGYDPEAVFPDGMVAMAKARGQKYVDYEGYYALNRWRRESRDQAYIRAIIRQIDKEMTPFEAGFLRRCIESTLFSDLCMRKVETFGDTVPRFGPKVKTGLPAEGEEDRVVCSFVDGVAARKGIPLSPATAR